MAESAQIIVMQLIKMFIFIVIGVCLYKSKLVTEDGSKSIANMLIFAVVPCVILNSLFVERTPESVKLVLFSLLAGALALAICFVISALLFRKNPMEHFGSAFANAGFMGLPLVTSALGAGNVICVTGFFLLQSVAMWFYNVLIMRKKDDPINFKSLFTSPITISLIVGFIIFFCGIKAPDIIKDCVTTLSACNSPVAMIVLGVYIGKTNFKEIFTTGRLYGLAATRLVLIPIATILVLFLVPAEYINVRVATLISASAPIAINTAVYSQKAGFDYTYAVKGVCLSTLLSIITLPLTVLAAGLIWNV